jgi:hypothetical protein
MMQLQELTASDQTAPDGRKETDTDPKFGNS